MTDSWYETYRSAILETDREKIRGRLLIAEDVILARLRALATDHGGDPKERQAIADALRNLQCLRTEIAASPRGSKEGA